MRLIFVPCRAWRPGALNFLASVAGSKLMRLGDCELGRRVDRAVMHGELEVPSASIAFDENRGSIRHAELMAKRSLRRNSTYWPLSLGMQSQVFG